MIRAATPDDVAALAALNREVQALHLAAMPERYRDPTPAEIEAHVRGLLATDGVVILVAVEVDGSVVGYAVVRRVDAPGHTYAQPRLSALVDQLGVRAGARRGGHGRDLMAAVDAQARAWGAAAITLDVQAFNTGAVEFYRALGYDTVTLRLARRLGP